MRLELLTPDEMNEVDRRAIATGPFDGYELMLHAGQAITRELLNRYAGASGFDVLCGPGNNGGDGYVVARLLAESGVVVRVWSAAEPRAGSDAGHAAADCPVQPRPLAAYQPQSGAVVVDALYGAGLSKPLTGPALEAVRRVDGAGGPVVSVDLPSGVSGATGQIVGEVAFRAGLTVMFATKKPGHLLYPGRAHCGEIIVADIGIPEAVIDELGVRTFENLPALWLASLPALSVDAHKYSRGHVGVFSGGLTSASAARMSALGAARGGAGAVTLLSPADALAVNAAHLTSIILREAGTLEAVLSYLAARKPQALVYGPGLGAEPEVGSYLLDILAALGDYRPGAVVVDADGLTSLARQARPVWQALAQFSLILTPHDGEFARLFPDIAGSRLERARAAAKLSGCIVLLKGADTVIASPDGRAAINSNGTPLLATAGSGDVLSGIIAANVAQGMPLFEGTCAAAWMHAEAANAFGPGLIAEDLPGQLPAILQQLEAMQAT